ncbi:ATP-grasp ribosomal peptide maturase [Actinokineospora diospyrosa]|uniref:ATP-grasp ribosomal peptide maturase, SAV_5884 family n=1 Tax=Actinokineospora diospyrosa TaxID=103728 RepID=A0ABT1I8H1_9PSEU|nr:ATP-grasp ribosomal peptide maturase [Actinokineospora diospyrosa]MCP2268934.1 ATP-grasp ribosomal peptide maturase, SAV_5884 family [Actinokineospora diospyrosa]
MTVLILAPELDLTADRMVDALQDRAVPVVRLDTAWFPQHVSIDAELRHGRWVGSLSTAGRTVRLEALRSIWYRSPTAFTFAEGMSPTERQWAMTEAKLGFGGVLSSLPVRWVNHPARNADASYKPVQLVTAARCGLQVTDTLITNTQTAVLRFAAAGQTVIKALGAPSIREEGGRKTAFTRLLDASDMSDLRGVEVTSHQFQRWVPKAYEARVIVVGDSVFAAAIHATTADAYVDWRNDYKALTYDRVDPPFDVLTGVRDYCRELGLVYGAFDFVVRPDGQWIFLECNAGGQYGWLEDAAELPITSALADLLAKGTGA